MHHPSLVTEAVVAELYVSTLAILYRASLSNWLGDRHPLMAERDPFSEAAFCRLAVTTPSHGWPIYSAVRRVCGSRHTNHGVGVTSFADS